MQSWKVDPIHVPDMAELTVPNMGTIVPNMGTTRIRRRTVPATSLGNALFSGTRQRILGLLFGRPNRSFYAKELIRLADGGSGAIQRELERLTKSGLVTVRPIGNQKHFQANPDAPIFAELCSVVQKTFGLADPLRKALEPLASRIVAAFIYGSVAKRQDTAASDIDLMIIADKLSYADVLMAVESVTSELGRQVTTTILTRRELAQRIKDRGSFVTRMLSQPKIWLIGTEDDVRI
jgi:predicted nucleotidyltransferase